MQNQEYASLERSQNKIIENNKELDNSVRIIAEGYLDGIITITQLNKINDEYRDKILQTAFAIRNERFETQQLNEEIEDNTKTVEENTDKTIKASDEKTQTVVDANNKIVEDTKESNEEIVEIEEKTTNKIIEEIKKRIQENEKYFFALSSLFSNVFGIFSSFEDAKIQKLEQSNDKQLTELEKQLEQGLINQEEFNKREIELNEKLQKEKRKAARDEAIREKAASLFSIVVNTASAVAQALPNLVLAGIVGAVGLAEGIKVATEPLPALAEGGVIPATPGGLPFIGGEAGQAEAVIPLDRLPEISSQVNNNQQFRIQIFNDEQLTSDKIYQMSENGLIKIHNRAIV